MVLNQTKPTKLTSIVKLKGGKFLAAGNSDYSPLAVIFDDKDNTVWTYYKSIFISLKKN
ncbi:MAG: hypothetical protein ACJASM_001001 [Salibacteraceae bacterium]|jgi:hypothetical protein